MKIKFDLDYNSAYPKLTGVINIIGKNPVNPPYLSISFHKKGNQVAHGWVKDKDLERLAVNILKALNSKKLKP